MAIHLALLITLLEILALCGVLFLWAKQVSGAHLLVVFLLGVATWIVGNELPNVLGLGSVPLAMALLSSLTFTSAAFFHFCVIFCAAPVDKRWIHVAYVVAALVALLSLVHSPGVFVHFPAFTGFQWVVVPNAVGWLHSAAWGILAAAGLLTLAWGWLYTPIPIRRGQFGSIAAACAWGLLAISGFAFAALGAVLIAIAAVHHARFTATLGPAELPPAWPVRMATWLALLMAALGAVLAGYLLLSAGSWG